MIHPITLQIQWERGSMEKIWEEPSDFHSSRVEMPSTILGEIEKLRNNWFFSHAKKNYNGCKSRISHQKSQIQATYLLGPSGDVNISPFQHKEKGRNCQVSALQTTKTSYLQAPSFSSRFVVFLGKKTTPMPGTVEMALPEALHTVVVQAIILTGYFSCSGHLNLGTGKRPKRSTFLCHSWG